MSHGLEVKSKVPEGFHKEVIAFMESLCFILVPSQPVDQVRECTGSFFEVVFSVFMKKSINGNEAIFIIVLEYQHK